MDENGKPAIWTPQGVKTLDGTPLARVEMRGRQMEWFRQFADFARHHEVGLHCSRCNGDIVGKNADTDAVFAVACQCREWIGDNREYAAVEGVH